MEKYSRISNSSWNSLDKAGKKSVLYTMLMIRRFEEGISDLLLKRDEADRAYRTDPENARPFPEEKRIRTPCHLYIGQEAVATGVCAVLRKNDSIWGSHRAHGHFIAKGGDIKSAMAEVFCRSTGCSKGRGGSMHLCDPDIGFMGSSAIVGGVVPLGVGAAMAEHVKGGDAVSVIFHGDAVPEEGVFHEALNWAVLKKLPVIFCCEDNFYSTHLHIKYRRRVQDLGLLVSGYGLPVIRVDGTDVREVMTAARDAVDKARNGEGPTFLHCQTYRWRGHVGPYDNLEVGLRSLDEVLKWTERCPIELERKRQEAESVLEKGEFEEMTKAAGKEIDMAIEFAVNSPRPRTEEVLDHVFRRSVHYA